MGSSFYGHDFNLTRTPFFAILALKRDKFILLSAGSTTDLTGTLRAQGTNQTNNK